MEESSYCRYSRDYTRSICSVLPREACVPLPGVLRGEGCSGKGDLPAEAVVSVDTLMALRRKGSSDRPASVDFAFGCGRGSVQLVECRYNYRNVTNLRRGELDSKVVASHGLLRDSLQPHLDYNPTATTVLLFSDGVKERALSQVRRLYPRTPQKKEPPFEVMTTKEFLAAFF